MASNFKKRQIHLMQTTNQQIYMFYKNFNMNMEKN